MKKRTIIITLCTAACFAASVAGGMAFGDIHYHKGHGEGSDLSEIILLDRMGLSIQDIAEMLEGKANHRILSISFEGHDSQPLTAFIDEGGTIYQIQIDPDSGSEKGRKKASFWSVWDEDWKNLPEDQFKLSASEIISKVEDSLNCKVWEIELDSEDGLHVYEVGTISNNLVREVLVDPITGTIYPDSEGCKPHRHDR